jgi:hypothetical protein
MRDLNSTEMDLVGGGLISLSTGDVNVGNGISALNGNNIASGNCIEISGNGNGNLSGNDITATVNAVLSGLGL